MKFCTDQLHAALMEYVGAHHPPDGVVANVPHQLLKGLESMGDVPEEIVKKLQKDQIAKLKLAVDEDGPPKVADPAISPD